MTNLIPVSKCIVCNSNEFQNAYTTHDRHYGIKGEFTIDQCKSCDLFFLNPMPTADYLTSLYPKTYYSYQPNFFNDNESSFFKKIYSKYIVQIKTLDPKFKQPGRVLDIGCGSGKFLYKMKKNGWEVHGVEVNEIAARTGNELANLNIHAGDLLSSNFKSNYFNYIRSNHSFEHIDNPNEVLAVIHRILKDDGKLMIGVPNIDSFNYRLFKKYWWYLGAPVHTFNYSVKTLIHLLERNNFSIEKVSYNGDYSGFIGSFQIYLNRKNGRMSDKGMFIQSPIMRAFSHQFAKFLNLIKVGDAMEIICTKK